MQDDTGSYMYQVTGRPEGQQGTRLGSTDSRRRAANTSSGPMHRAQGPAVWVDVFLAVVTPGYGRRFGNTRMVHVRTLGT